MWLHPNVSLHPGLIHLPVFHLGVVRENTNTQDTQDTHTHTQDSRHTQLHRRIHTLFNAEPQLEIHSTAGLLGEREKEEMERERKMREQLRERIMSKRERKRERDEKTDKWPLQTRRESTTEIHRMLDVA